MCVLVKEYERNLRKYLRHKHQYSIKSEKDRKNRVIKFLKFCCSRGVRSIKDITKDDFDKFIQTLSKYSVETRRKYRLALKEFFDRAHLNIRVNVQRAVKREKLKKFERLKQILDCCDCVSEHKREILEIL